MEILLFKIEEVLSLPSLGPVLYPGVPASGPSVKVGQQITIRYPDGQEVRTVIKSVPLINRRDYKGFTPIELPKSFTSEDIPIGSQVIINDEVQTAA